jgi:golgi-specific brefeldin A-resistance guanine nucleotide exchange factor 1
MTNLQRILLGPPALIMGNDPCSTSDEDIFNQVLFPLIDDLLKPEVIQRDPTGMTETRVRACSLLCRAFLLYEIQPNNGTKDVRDIWLQLLDLLEHLMGFNKRDPLVCVSFRFVALPD